MRPYIFAIVVSSFVIFLSKSSIGQNSQKTVADIASAVLMKNGSAGGIENIYECTPLVSKGIAVYGSTTEDQLKSIRIAYPLKWTNLQGAYLVRVNSSNSDSLLDVVLPQIVVSEDNLTLATGTLFYSNAVQKEETRLKLKLFDRSIGYSPVRPKSATVGKLITLPSATLGEDLSRIALYAGKAVWLYEQGMCGGHRTGQFSWILQ